MKKLTGFPLPGSISINLPFNKAIDEEGTIQEGIRIKVSGFEILSSSGELGDPELIKAILEAGLRKIIEDMAIPKFTLISLQSFFEEDKAISIPGRPGLFLRKNTLIFEEESQKEG